MKTKNLSKSPENEENKNNNKDETKKSKVDNSKSLNPYLKVIEKHKDKAPFDVPIKMYKHDLKKAKNTTLNEEFKDLKCALIVNIASKDGTSKKHFE